MPACFHCHKPMNGRTIIALDHDWHPECFLCAGCGRRIEGQFLEHDSQPYHENCYHELFSPRCAIGGEPMRSTYLTNDWGDIFCRAHKDECPACTSCGRPICQRLTRGGVQYGDGRAMCNLCRRTAIDKPEQALAILGQVRRSLAKNGLDLQDAILPLHLVDQPELNRRNTHAFTHHPSGMTCTSVTTQGNHVVKRSVEEVLILHGLPGEHFATIAAHEFGHAWLFLNEFPELPPYVAEGICELCSYLWLSDQATDAARHRIDQLNASNDDVYGKGYHAALKCMACMSFPALLKSIRERRQFP